MRKPMVMVFLSLSGLVLAACGSTTAAPASNKPDKVQIAAEGPFTGDEASIGAGALQAIKLAVKDFNTAGGVNGTPRCGRRRASRMKFRQRLVAIEYSQDRSDARRHGQARI